MDQKVIEDAAQESGDTPRGSLAPPSILENIDEITRNRGLDARTAYITTLTDEEVIQHIQAINRQRPLGDAETRNKSVKEAIGTTDYCWGA